MIRGGLAALELAVEQPHHLGGLALSARSSGCRRRSRRQLPAKRGQHDQEHHHTPTPPFAAATATMRASLLMRLMSTNGTAGRVSAYRRHGRGTPHALGLAAAAASAYVGGITPRDRQYWRRVADGWLPRGRAFLTWDRCCAGRPTARGAGARTVVRAVDGRLDFRAPSARAAAARGRPSAPPRRRLRPPSGTSASRATRTGRRGRLLPRADRREVAPARRRDIDRTRSQELVTASGRGAA
jgi:hypothetical protein